MNSSIEDSEEKFKNKDVSLVKITNNDDATIARKIEALEQWEAHVIAHERMHQLSGGGMVGSPSYTYTYGPDGKKYIQGGEVTFYLPVGLSVEAGIEAIKKLKAAASAPADPSPADMKAAAMAGALEGAYRSKLIIKQAKEAYDKNRIDGLEIDDSKDYYVSPIATFKFKEVSGFELFI